MSKRFKCGLIVGKFAPPHWGHVLLIEEAARQCEYLDIFTYSNPDMKAYRSIYRSHDLMKSVTDGKFSTHARKYGCEIRTWVFSERDGAPRNDAPAEVQRQFVDEKYHYYISPLAPPDAVFGSDEYIYGFAKYIGATPVRVERFADMNATAIRREPYAYPQVEWMPKPVYEYYNENYAEKVVFVGGESTGKSTTAMACAQAMQGAYIPEVGAEVFKKAGGVMLDEDLWNYTVRQQRVREDEAVKDIVKYRYIFCDTEAMTTKFFMYWMLGYANEYVEKLARESKSRYHHWFLCGDEIPFDGSNMRGPQEIRKLHQGMIKMMLKDAGIEYTHINGSTKERVDQVKQELHAARQADWVDLSC